LDDNYWIYLVVFYVWRRMMKEEGTCKDGKLNGKSTVWYENGQKKVEGTRKDGKLIVVTWWDEDGNVIKQFPPHHVCYF
jgi:antitoxin component YwqK of YwqJK toxin-antitoxin module